MNNKNGCLYETHLHTFPVSRCAIATVRESLEFYKGEGYTGVFITNHFIDGNINVDANASYAEKIGFYFSDYEKGVEIGKEIGLDVFCGVESSYHGTDFLIYGLDKQWFLDHPEIEGMKKKDQLALFERHGALIVHAHPFREAVYIDHIKLYPRNVHAVEVYNAGRTELENNMARLYCENYKLVAFAGTDNHIGVMKHLGGMMTPSPIESVADFIEQVKDGRAVPFERTATE